MAGGAADSTQREPTRGRAGAPDQGRLGIFRALMLLQLLSAGFFGLFPYVAPAEFARLFGLVGDEPYLYRLTGAATLGYAVVGAIGALGTSWVSLRVAFIATLTFNLAAAAAALLAIDESGLTPLPAVVGLAGVLYSIVAAYWLFRDQGAREDVGEPLEPAFRVALAVATLAAAFFGLAPLLLPRTFAGAAGFSTADLVVIRFAGAATLGYAVAGVFEVLVNRWPAIRLQTIAAITFNALSAIASAIYLAGGGTSIVAVLVLLASAFFTLALTGFAARAER